MIVDAHDMIAYDCHVIACRELSISAIYQLTFAFQIYTGVSATPINTSITDTCFAIQQQYMSSSIPDRAVTRGIGLLNVHHFYRHHNKIFSEMNVLYI
jgi:hypothetical protein